MPNGERGAFGEGRELVGGEDEVREEERGIGELGAGKGGDVSGQLLFRERKFDARSDAAR